MLIDPTLDSLPLVRQTELLSISRSSIYYEPIEDAEEDLIKRRIDEIYTEYPYLGSRRIGIFLKREGFTLGRYKVMSLMQIMGIKALYPKKNTSIPNKQHQKYPYLLKNLKITRINQVWATDITYIRLKKGWIYLIAIIDWYSRKVLSWRVSTIMDVSFCIQALEEALTTHGKPEIFNTDQGSQFTSLEFTQKLESNQIRISMDGKGRYSDNIFTERLWRTVKYEEVYLKDYSSPIEAIQSLKQYFLFYNTKRPHQSLEYRTPDEVYYGIKIEITVRTNTEARTTRLFQTKALTRNLNLILS